MLLVVVLKIQSLRHDHLITRLPNLCFFVIHQHLLDNNQILHHGTTAIIQISSLSQQTQILCTLDAFDSKLDTLLYRLYHSRRPLYPRRGYCEAVCSFVVCLI